MSSRRVEAIAHWASALHVPLAAAAVLGLGVVFLGLDVRVLARPPLPIADPFWAQLGLLTLACAALLWKQRAPVVVLAVVTGLWLADLALGGSLGTVLVFFDALYSAVLHGTDRFRRALLVVIVVVDVAGVALALAITGDARMGALAALQLFALLVTPYWWALAVQRERARGLLEAQRADDLERLADLTQQDAVLHERSRMARDLHDAIASEDAAAIAIHSEAALAGPSPRPGSLETIRAASIRSLEQMRSMILVLRDGGNRPWPRTGSATRTGSSTARVGSGSTCTSRARPEPPGRRRSGRRTHPAGVAHERHEARARRCGRRADVDGCAGAAARGGLDRGRAPVAHHAVRGPRRATHAGARPRARRRSRRRSASRRRCGMDGRGRLPLRP